MWPMLAAGMLKFGYDKYHENLNRQAEATKEMYAPWTGHQDQGVDRANLMGDAMSGATTGMQMDQSSAAAGQNAKLSDAMSNYYNSEGAAPGTFGAMQSGQGANLMQGMQFQQDPELAKFAKYGA